MKQKANELVFEYTSSSGNKRRLIKRPLRSYYGNHDYIIQSANTGELGEEVWSIEAKIENMEVLRLVDRLIACGNISTNQNSGKPSPEPQVPGGW